jgi:hypothetical protein
MEGQCHPTLGVGIEIKMIFSQYLQQNEKHKISTDKQMEGRLTNIFKPFFVI